MAKIYVRMIQTGRLTLPDVPERWQQEVKALLYEE